MANKEATRGQIYNNLIKSLKKTLSSTIDYNFTIMVNHLCWSFLTGTNALHLTKFTKFLSLLTCSIHQICRRLITFESPIQLPNRNKCINQHYLKQNLLLTLYLTNQYSNHITRCPDCNGQYINRNLLAVVWCSL